MLSKTTSAGEGHTSHNTALGYFIRSLMEGELLLDSKLFGGYMKTEMIHVTTLNACIQKKYTNDSTDSLDPCLRDAYSIDNANQTKVFNTSCKMDGVNIAKSRCSCNCNNVDCCCKCASCQMDSSNITSVCERYTKSDSRLNDLYDPCRACSSETEDIGECAYSLDSISNGSETNVTSCLRHRKPQSDRQVRHPISFLDFKFLLFGVLLLCQGIRCLDNNNILQLNIPTEEPVVDPNTVCKTFPDLSPKQYRLCAKYPDVTASAIQGLQIAIHECQHQLKEHRWNCSSLEKKNKNPHSSPLLRKGFRESAFAYALSSAGVTHQVSKACSMGKLHSCGCDMSMQGEVKAKFEWGGCSHNVDFGDRFAKKFTSAREAGRDIHARINLHNNRAGRMVILKNVRKQCKCHGMSGSCEVKTCWKVSPDFRIVGEILKKKFRTASKVNLNNYADSRSKRRVVRKQPNTELVFYEKSPNFCESNPNVDSPGTTGRFCNKSKAGPGNCETLCCGRGYNTMRIRRTERCNCKFHWCCYVVCQTCTYNEWVTVCK